ncbi:hypothetical protein JCM17380_24610 [Desulfosporosinus burensis]
MTNSGLKNNLLAEFEEMIDDMVADRPAPEMSERFQLIEITNEEFLKQTGENLPSFMLSKFADWCLLEVLNDRDVDKVSNNDFAVLSPRQLRRRDRRENSVDGEVMDYLNQRYVKKKDSLAKKAKKDSDY